MISQYNLEQPKGLHNLTSIVMKQVRMQGYLVFDYYHIYPKYLEMILPMIRECSNYSSWTLQRPQHWKTSACS
ncbi:hypothetical protein REPUB_Repub01dG0102500 [Reevesia pubescens]